MIGSSVRWLDRPSHMGAFGGGQNDIVVGSPPGAAVEGAPTTAATATTGDATVGTGAIRAIYVVSATGANVMGESEGADGVHCNTFWPSTVWDAMMLRLATSDGVDSTSIRENAIVPRTALKAISFTLIVLIKSLGNG